MVKAVTQPVSTDAPLSTYQDPRSTGSSVATLTQQLPTNYFCPPLTSSLRAQLRREGSSLPLGSLCLFPPSTTATSTFSRDSQRHSSYPSG
ncbi:hypothetical protein E2C01_024174 [Portunus trituberculatus]|uniref:Uncharacterized protein n=1 Tax=Portunus trituberculatus TaxID=210409 RepID=A0A5B7E9Z5_PORTR|nr:hypothetical protein [Portunus trituberculatus]